jgi:hypothetical protein
MRAMDLCALRTVRLFAAEGGAEQHADRDADG